MKHVMGINITLNSNIAHLAPIVLTARQRQKERQEAIEKQEHEMPPLHGAPGYKGIGPKHGPLDR